MVDEKPRDLKRELLDEVAKFLIKQPSPNKTALTLQAKIEDAYTIEDLECYRKAVRELKC